MKKAYAPEQLTSADLRKALKAMNEDERFSSRRRRRELILQTSRLSGIENDSERQLITAERQLVELKRLFYALQDLALEMGIDNFLEFAGLAAQE